jgi:hypothetical protein
MVGVVVVIIDPPFILVSYIFLANTAVLNEMSLRGMNRMVHTEEQSDEAISSKLFNGARIASSRFVGTRNHNEEFLRHLLLSIYVLIS